MKARQNPHHLAAASAHHDVTTHSIKYVNRFSLPAKKPKTTNNNKKKREYISLKIIS